MSKQADPKHLGAIIRQAKTLARKYYTLTGRPLGVTGEVGEYEACRLLGLRLADVRETGFDASRYVGTRRRRYQIKTRCLLPGCKPGQRMGAIKLEKPWDAVLLVLLNDRFEATEIHEASRTKVTRAIQDPGSMARARGQLGVTLFKKIGKQVWAK
jgi:hypothetical protein